MVLDSSFPNASVTPSHTKENREDRGLRCLLPQYLPGEPPARVRYFISLYCLHSPHTSGSSKMDLLLCNIVLKYLPIGKIKHLDKKHNYLQIIYEIPVWFAKKSVHVS